MGPPGVVDLEKQALVVAGGGDPEDRLGCPDGVGEACEDRVGGILGNLPLQGIDGDLDVHLAEEEAEDGQGAEQDDEDVGDQRHQTGIAVGAVVVHQGPAYHHYQGLSTSAAASEFPHHLPRPDVSALPVACYCCLHAQRHSIYFHY